MRSRSRSDRTGGKTSRPPFRRTLDRKPRFAPLRDAILGAGGLHTALAKLGHCLNRVHAEGTPKIRDHGPTARRRACPLLNLFDRIRYCARKMSLLILLPRANVDEGDRPRFNPLAQL